MLGGFREFTQHVFTVDETKILRRADEQRWKRSFHRKKCHGCGNTVSMVLFPTLGSEASSRVLFSVGRANLKTEISGKRFLRVGTFLDGTESSEIMSGRSA